ncbi:hypothetical protein MMC14_004657 [Varicellaria rhodocarpa]|nr:hypothetical protein [Varicellaria rhodocarpa]
MACISSGSIPVLPISFVDCDQNNFVSAVDMLPNLKISRLQKTSRSQTEPFKHSDAMTMDMFTLQDLYVLHMKDSSLSVEQKIKIARDHLEYLVQKLDSVHHKLGKSRDEKRIRYLHIKMEILVRERRNVTTNLATLIETAEL